LRQQRQANGGFSRVPDWSARQIPYCWKSRNLERCFSGIGSINLLVPLPLTTKLRRNIFCERTDSVKQHLAMVFHRFLTGRNAVAIHLNGRRVEPWDPFMEDAEAVDPPPTETLSADDARIDVKTPSRKQAMHGEKILAEARKLGFRD
jgi:hypothetical protein